MIVRRMESWCYELLRAWCWWRNRELIGLLRESRGLPSQRCWKASIAYLWEALAG